MKSLRFLFILLFITQFITAQTKKPKKNKPERIIYTGLVLDKNNEPIPFVNVFMAKGKYGTTTDFNGEFTLKTRRKRGKITFTATGYQTKIIKIKPKQTYIKVVLEEEQNVLDEIVIVQKPKKHLKKKENPAYRILKKIWKNKKKNGLRQVDKYEYKKHEITEIGLNRIDSTFLKKIFKKDYQQVLKELPFDNEGFHYYIPIFIKESIYHIYGNNRLKKKRIDIEAEKSKGLSRQGFVFDRMANKFDEIDIYKNTFNLFNKAFVSPISSTGFDTYDYLLYDSIQVNNQKLYNIYFFPRRNEDLAFEGHFSVSDKSFAITKITMKLNKDANLNFVRSAYIEKEYNLINDSVFLPKTDIFEGDFTLLDKNNKNKGINIKKTYRYSGYQFDQNYPAGFYDAGTIKYKPHQFQKSEDYWKKISGASSTEKTYQLIEEIGNKKQIQNITKSINIVTTGYMDIGNNLQFGPLFKTIGRNGVEDWRLTGGFRTFKTADDRFRLIGHLAYGTKDKKIKYGLQAKYLLSYKPRVEINLTSSDDYVQQSRSLLNVSNIMFTENFGSNFMLARGDNYFLTRIQEQSLKIDYRMAPNFHLGIIPAYKIYQPADRRYFNMDYIDKNGKIRHSLTDAGSDIYLTYTPGRQVYGYGVEQRYGKNPYPSIIVNYHKSSTGWGSDFSYDKLQFRFMQRLLWGKIGKTDLTIETGKTFGTVPLTLLNPIPANQVLILKPNTFSLLNYYDFITDTYAVAHFEHHFDGFILNRIPLIRKLKWRVVSSFHIAYGSISESNKVLNRSHLQYMSPEKTPYYEYSFGLENIGYGNLRFFRVDAIWRSDYQSIHGLSSPKFAIRVGIKPGF